MSLATSIASDSKPTRRRVSKATKGGVVKPQKISIYVTPESAKRLGIHSTMEGRSQSAIVEELIRENLRRFVVQDRGKPAEDTDRDDQVVDDELIGNGTA